MKFSVSYLSLSQKCLLKTVDKQNPDFDRGISGGEGNEIDLDQTNENSATGKPSSGIEPNHNPTGNEVFIMDNRAEDRTASFFAQPGILAGMYYLIILIIQTTHTHTHQTTNT